MYKRILVPVDGSNTSQAALKEVVHFTQLCPDAAIRLLHVIDMMQASSGVTEFASSAIPVTMLEDDIRKQGQAVLGLMIEKSKEVGFTPESALVESFGKSMADVIVDDANAWGADIIIMGTHGYSGLTHLLVGSVAEGVIRLTPVPVLLVRSPA